MLTSLSRLGFGGSGQEKALPQALTELQGLTFSIVAGVGANVLTPVPNLEAEDTIAAILNVTDWTQVNLAHCTLADRRASGTITVLTTVVDGDTVTVNGKVYTFKQIIMNNSTNLLPRVVPINVLPSGIDVTATALALANAIMSGDNSVQCVSVAGVVTVTARLAGVAGNAFTLVTSSAHCTVSGAVLAGGAAPGVLNGFKCSDSLTGKNLLVIWYDKNWNPPAEVGVFVQSPPQ